MQKVVRDIGLFVVAPLVILGGLTAWMFAATTPACSNGIVKQLVSPDDKFTAVVFVRSCNNVPGFSSNISVLVKDGILADGPGNLFISDWCGCAVAGCWRQRPAASGQQQIQRRSAASGPGLVCQSEYQRQLSVWRSAKQQRAVKGRCSAAPVKFAQ